MIWELQMFRVPHWVKGLSTSLSSINMAYARPSTEIIWSSGSFQLREGCECVWPLSLCTGAVKEGFVGKVAFGLCSNGCVGVLVLLSNLLCVLPPAPTRHQAVPAESVSYVPLAQGHAQSKHSGEPTETPQKTGEYYSRKLGS